MSHWVKNHKSDLEEITSKYNWELNISDNDKGPVILEAPDGSEVSIVHPDHTRTVAVEYVPDDSATEGVKLNRGKYYHQSFSWGDENDAVEDVVNIIEQHEKKN